MKDKHLNIEKTRHHINELRNRHSRLEKEINMLMYTHQPEEKISELKKEKLRLKDEITSLERKIA